MHAYGYPYEGFGEDVCMQLERSFVQTEESKWVKSSLEMYSVCKRKILSTFITVWIFAVVLENTKFKVFVSFLNSKNLPNLLIEKIL